MPWGGCSFGGASSPDEEAGRELSATSYVRSTGVSSARSDGPWAGYNTGDSGWRWKTASESRVDAPVVASPLLNITRTSTEI